MDKASNEESHLTTTNGAVCGAWHQRLSHLLPAVLIALGLPAVNAPMIAAGEGSPPAPKTARDLGDAFRRSTFSFGLRYRAESVADDAAAFAGKDALASTLRTTLAMETLPWKGLRLFVSAEDVSTLGNDLYNNAGAGPLSNHRADRPVVADPEITEISQAYFGWVHGTTEIRAGRYELNLGNQRFVGAVGWRQNHQEFDALMLRNGGENFEWRYAYLDRVHTITGAQQALEGHVGEAIFPFGNHRLTATAVVLDYDAPSLADFSSNTAALRYEGKQDLGAANDSSADPASRLSWDLELARQNEHGANPRSFDLDYRRAELVWKRSALLFAAGFERLQGNGLRGFRTPLATLHKWNGWADKFLVTPPDGLDDLTLGISGNHVPAQHGSLRWSLVWHDFSAQRVSSEYGSELDAEVRWTTTWKQSFALKMARYGADAFGTDTTKIFLETTWAFAATAKPE